MNRRKYLTYSTLVLSLLILWNFKLINYGVSQLKGQITILTNSKDIDLVLNDKNLPDSVKFKLRLVQKIKQFAIDSIGLSPSDAYQTVFNQEGKPALKIITACKPFELEDYTWSFPLLGEVSYKGFFNEELLQQEKDKISAKNYDLNISEVTAWSTLGWFKDPILTNFLNRSDGMLSNLIIHELTHGTIYVTSDVYFNENLANFIGNEGAKEFLKSTFSDTSLVYKKYLEEIKNEKILTDFVVLKANGLDSLYQTFDSQMNYETKAEIKHQFMLTFIGQLEQLPIKSIKRYIPAIETLNNTYFQSFRRYNSNLSLFEEEFKNHKNLASYVKQLKIEYQ